MKYEIPDYAWPPNFYFYIELILISYLATVVVAKEQFVGIPSTQCEDLSEVTNALNHALLSVMPKRNYRCGTWCKFDYYLYQLPGRIHTWLRAMTPPPDATTQADH